MGNSLHRRLGWCVVLSALLTGPSASSETGADPAGRTDALGTAPLIRGTLWWITPCDGTIWSRDRLAKAIDAQCAVGFDVLWILNTPALLEDAEATETKGDTEDIMGRVYDIADERKMRVIADLPKGGWYGKTTADEMSAEIGAYVRKYGQRYGSHPSFYGWYLNHEINPIAPEDAGQSAYWRQAWKEVVRTCKEAAPRTVVTISPFFLLDKPSRRGFVYLTPEQYAAWWGATLEETGIDILMLQDSGEHLSFFTLEQREPYFAAVAEACHAAGAQFWVNVETGEAHVKDWDEFLELSAKGKAPWRFTPMDWLERKLRLAARYGDSIINWGYYPYMDPAPLPGKKQQGHEDAHKAYETYRTYCEGLESSGVKLPPLE